MFSRGGAAGTGYGVGVPAPCPGGDGHTVAVAGTGWKRIGAPAAGTCTLLGGGEAARCDVTIDEARAELRRRLDDARLDGATVGFGAICGEGAPSGLYVQVDDWADADGAADAIGRALHQLNAGDTVHLLVAGQEIACPMIGCGM
jgi:hypothetical protein